MAEQPIQLSELIAELRRELATAQAQGHGHDVRLEVTDFRITGGHMPCDAIAGT